MNIATCKITTIKFRTIFSDKLRLRGWGYYLGGDYLVRGFDPEK